MKIFVIQAYKKFSWAKGYSYSVLCKSMTLQICSLGVSLPFSLPPHGNLASKLALSPLPSSLSPLSPFANIQDDTLWSLATSLRGTPPNYPLRYICNKNCATLIIHEIILSSGEDVHYGVCSHPSHVLAIHLSETVPSVNRSAPTRPIPQFPTHCSQYATVQLAVLHPEAPPTCHTLSQNSTRRHNDIKTE